MSSANPPPTVPPSGRFGLRLAFWYAAVFVASSLAIVLLTYTLLASSLTERDRQIVQSTLREYSSRYSEGGLPALARAVDIEQRSGRHERLFVRVVRAGTETLFVTMPPEWSDFDISSLAGRSGPWEQAPSESRNARLEVASARLLDGTLLQVGKSTESREELLSRFRYIVALVSVAIVLVGLAGGMLVTRRMLEPIHRLIAAVTGITATGNTETRVPVGDDRDAIDQLSVLFNQMLDRISTLIAGMGSALDNVAHDLRTPMTRLRGVAERALASGDANAQREALSTSLEESERILAMLDTLMDISEAETGTMRLALADVALPSARQRGRQRLRGRGRRQGDRGANRDRTRSARHGRPRSPAPGARQPSRQRHQVHAAGRTGLDPRQSRRRRSRARRRRYRRRRISPHDLPRIWERLYRGDQSRAERGLGLGLSLVKAIVLAHGGTVDVTTQPGVGSTFTIRLLRLRSSSGHGRSEPEREPEP